LFVYLFVRLCLCSPISLFTYIFVRLL
jgi:hypothetical protein